MPEAKSKMRPKARIMQAAVAEFAARGFTAVSVKEIAEKAGVNVAMISYYFGGKSPLIEAILLRFFSQIQDEIKDAILHGASFETNAHRLCDKLIAFFRSHADLCRLCLLGITAQTPQLATLKSQKQAELFAVTHALMLTRTMPGHVSPKTVGILATAFVGLVFSHLLIDPSTLERLQMTCDDSYFSEYTRAIPLLFLGGIEGVLSHPEPIECQ